MQDEQLDDLARGVDRLGNLANTMNDETTLHVNLLNDLDSSVDRAAMGLRAETQHAERVRAQSANCWMYFASRAFPRAVLLLVPGCGPTQPAAWLPSARFAVGLDGALAGTRRARLFDVEPMLADTKNTAFAVEVCSHKGGGAGGGARDDSGSPACSARAHERSNFFGLHGKGASARAGAGVSVARASTCSRARA